MSRPDRAYAWWGRHPLAYRAGSQAVFLGRQRPIRERAVERLGLCEGDTVLDLGCGQGVNFEHLRRRVGPSGHVIGLDVNRAMLERARQSVESAGWENVDLIEADAAGAEFKESSLDGALCTLALSVIPDHLGALEVARGALRPGARLVVLDAQLFRGRGRALNALLKPAFGWTTAWRWERDLPAALESVFGQVELEGLNGGTLFIASATKISTGTRR